MSQAAAQVDRRRWVAPRPLQALAMIVIMVVALVTAALGQPWAGSMAEFCAVLDSVLAVFVIVLSLIG